MKKMSLIPVIGAMALASLVTVFSYVGCGGGGGSSGSSADTTAPQPLTIGPAGNATGIALNAVITATFSEAMDPATITNTTFTLYDIGNDIDVTGTVTYSNLTATFTPTANLVLANRYRARINTGAKDLAGNALAANYIWYFNTRDGAWGAAELIEADNAGAAQYPQIAFGPDGKAIAVWQQSNGTTTSIYANIYVSGTGWAGASLIETDEDGNASNPRIAFDSFGNAIAVWEQLTNTAQSILTNRYVSPTGWTGAALLEASAETAYRPKVAMNSAGNGIVAWEQSDGTQISTYANRYVSGTGWTGTILLEASDLGAVNSINVGLDQNSNAMVVWDQYDGTKTSIYANRYVSGTGWAGAGLVETNDLEDAAAPQIAVYPYGYFMAVWKQGGASAYSIYASRFVSGTGWSGAALLETSAEDVDLPQVAFDSQGFAIAVWHQITNTAWSIFANYYNCEGNTWTGPVLLETEDSQDAGNHQIAFDQDQNAIVIWEQMSVPKDNIYVSRYLRSTNAWGGRVLIETDDVGHAARPQIAFDSFGNAIAVWHQADATRNNIWANRFVFE